MSDKFKKNQRTYLMIVIVLCIGLIVVGGARYVTTLQKNLVRQSIQTVMTVTEQQRQAFDNFISEDQQRLHSYAEYFAQDRSGDVEDNGQKLTLFGDVDAFYTIMNLDTGRCCGNKVDGAFNLDDKELAVYRALTGSGVRDPYTSLYTDDTMFGYYERFTFADGVPGLIQKSYDCSKVSEAFSLSFYNNQGFAYVVNRQGDILLRSVGDAEGQDYDSIFDVLFKIHGEQQDINTLMEVLRDRQLGSMIFDGDEGGIVYTCVPVENAEDWCLVSIVAEEAIMEETNNMLVDSRQAFALLLVVLLVCAVMVVLFWQTFRELRNKEQEIDYRTQLFNIFSTYLSRNTDDVYIMLDAASNAVEYVSPNLERVFGISEAQMMEHTHNFKTTYETGEKMDIESLRNLRPGDGTETINTEWINPRTGERRWFRQSVYCTQIQGNNKLVIYVSDRTRERKTQETLAEALRMAQAANDAKSSFLSSVSHDIRTPMNAIIGFLALMEDEADNPGMVREYAQRIDSASKHLLGLINDVLDMNKIESGGTTLSISEFNLAEVIDELNTIIRPQTKAKDQTFDIFVSPLTYESLRGDKLRINQILINLLSNAVKYTPEKGRIEMRVDELPRVVDNYSRIRFTVKDNGLGMSEEYQRVLFEPFTREETAITHEIQGTGLGMAITKSLVDLMGGTIQVNSELNKGSVFTVELELAIQEREDDAHFWKGYSVTRMIVADDDEELCRNIVRQMTQVGVTAHYATDGERVIQMMRQAREAGQPYDLILLDWKMPNLNGLETARLIRKNYPDRIPILLLTAYDWSDIEEDAVEIGVDHFMPKPFFMSTFKEAIRRIMGDTRKQKADEGDFEGRHILVVDDIEVNRIILVKILTTLGASCDVAGNGQEAVDTFLKSRPGEYDLILMDVQMPVMDGYAATRAIRASGHPSAGTVPIIAMTANAFVDDVRDAINSGMDAHIAKPIQLDKLKSTIRQVLEHKQEMEISEKERTS